MILRFPCLRLIAGGLGVLDVVDDDVVGLLPAVLDDDFVLLVIFPVYLIFLFSVGSLRFPRAGGRLNRSDLCEHGLVLHKSS